MNLNSFYADISKTISATSDSFIVIMWHDQGEWVLSIYLFWDIGKGRVQILLFCIAFSVDKLIITLYNTRHPILMGFASNNDLNVESDGVKNLKTRNLRHVTHSLWSWLICKPFKINCKNQPKVHYVTMYFTLIHYSYSRRWRRSPPSRCTTNKHNSATNKRTKWWKQTKEKEEEKEKEQTRLVICS